MTANRRVSDNGYEILIVEDSPTQAAQLEHLLIKRGYFVRVAANGEEALAAIKEQKPTVVLSDIQMPGMDGYELCQKIKSQKEWSDLPVVLLTALVAPQDILNGLKCGADNFICKPYDQKYLCSRLSQILTNRELRRQEMVHFGVELELAGERYFLTAERHQILDLLISTAQEAARTNEDLRKRQQELEESRLALDALYRLAARLNQSRSQREAIEGALGGVRQLPWVQAAWIQLLDEDGNIHADGSFGLPAALEAPGALEGDCLCRRKLLAGALGEAANIYECERLTKTVGDSKGHRYHASVALRGTNRALGLLNLVGASPGELSKQELVIVEGAGHQLAAALERINLQQRLENLVEQRTAALRAEIAERKQAEEEIRLLQTVTLAVSEATNLPSALQVVLEKVCETTGWAVGEAWTPSADGRHLEWGGAFYAKRPELEEFCRASQKFVFPPGIGLAGRVWSAKEPAWIRDVSLDANMPRRLEALKAGLKAGLAVPVRAGDTVVAVVDFFVQEERGEDARLIGVVSGVAAQLGTVIQRKQAEEEIRSLNEGLEERVRERTLELEAANKELEAFTYSVSHDLRAPLRHIDGFTRILAEEYSSTLDPSAKRYLERVCEGTLHMGQLIDDLLALARVGRQEVRRQVTGLNSLVEEALQQLQPELKERRVEWQIDPLPYVECDPGLMKQVFLNLLSNAIKYTRPRSPAHIEVGQREQDGETVVYVRDNGVGFSMKYADKLFGVFQRLHRREDFEGTGVGLAIVRRIIHKHGGRIWAEAELNRGATFSFTLGGNERGVLENQAPSAE